jgi:hypothetical protein
MNVVITVDTEEDAWGKYSITNNSVENVEHLVPLQKLFDRYGARPTYLVTYPVATNSKAVTILRKMVGEGKCEIGMHCHPWNTPPFEEKAGKLNTMLLNLPEPLIVKKLTVLHEVICKNVGIAPVSFRAGRWGFSSAVARSILQLGYRVDTTITPCVDWSRNLGPDFTNANFSPYRFDPDNIFDSKEKGALLEIPTTIGFLQNDFNRCRKLLNFLNADIFKKIHLPGILERFFLLNKVWLSPEFSNARTMILLAKQVHRQNNHCLNMTFHSNTLLPCATPFVKSEADKVELLSRIEKLLMYSVKSKYNFSFLSQMLTHV